MAKSFPDAILDLMLQVPEGTHIHVCAGEPIDFADITNKVLAEQAIVGSYQLAAGDVSGRKNTRPAQSDIPIATNGTADHVAISNNTDTMYEVTTVDTPQALVSGGTVSTSAYDHELPDPV